MSNGSSGLRLLPFLPAAVFIGIFVLLLALLLPDPAPPTRTLTLQTETAVALVPTATCLPPTATRVPPTAQAVAYAPAAVEEGRAVFSSVCSACHGLDARGIPGLGKNLVESTFVHGLSDEDLLHFIVLGRDSSDLTNTSGIPMPPRGGNPSLTDDHLRSVIAFLRSESGSAPGGQAAADEVLLAATVTPAPRIVPILPTAIPVTPQPFSAQAAYTWSCSGCHGVDGRGNAPFASGFLGSPLLADRVALLSFLAAAHPPVDPGIEFRHPSRGGYPALSDEQLVALSDYVMEMAGD